MREGSDDTGSKRNTPGKIYKEVTFNNIPATPEEDG